MTDEVEARVAAVVAHETDRPAAEIAPAQKLAFDLGVDSLDFVKLIAAIEDAFGIVLDDEAAAGIETVADLVAVVRRTITSP
ncbi:MAG: acyl carrier protein [Alphaproteobacteria bacterium]